MHRKRILALALAMSVLLTLFQTVALAQEAAPQPIDTGSAKACLVVDAKSGRVVFDMNSSKKLPVAGLARLAALLCCCDGFDDGAIAGGEMVTIDEKASKIGGTTAFLNVGESIDAASLMLACAMINAGDATHSLCTFLYGSESNALEKINQRLNSIGVSTMLTDICGKGSEFSCLDLAAIAAELIKSPSYAMYGTKFFETISHDGGRKTELANPNKLIKQYSGCLGGGTGSSKEAGYSGVFAAKRGDTVFISAVIGASSGAERFEIAKAMLDYAFSSFRSVRVIGAGENCGSVSVKGALTREVDVETAEDITLLLKTNASDYTVETELFECLEAPVIKGAPAGRLILRDKTGELLLETELVAARSIPHAGFMDCVKAIIRFFIRNP